MDLLLIGGVSGSGKSVALAALEDSGYYAVSNLPLPLLAETARYLAAAGRTASRSRSTSRPGRGSPALPATIDALRAAGWSVRFLYLDAKTAELVKRFSETRRRHPLSSDTRTLTEAIEDERALLAEVRPLGFAFDTSDLSAAALRNWIKDFISVDATRLTLLFESFGFKHGVPLDADLVFDVRCLPNPHYETALAPLTGSRRRRWSPSSRSCPKSSACTTTSTTSSAAGCPTTRATTATTSPSRSAAPAAGTARSTWSSGSRAHSRRATRC